MATDATGTPTSPDNIPKYNINVDPPSGNGFNAAMDQIQTVFNTTVRKPTTPSTGDALVFNGTTWDKSSGATKVGVGGIAPGSNGQWLKTAGGVPVWANIAPADISGYPADSSKFLRGDGNWATPASATTTGGVTTATVTVGNTYVDTAVAHGLGTTPRAVSLTPWQTDAGWYSSARGDVTSDLWWWITTWDTSTFTYRCRGENYNASAVTRSWYFAWIAT